MLQDKKKIVEQLRREVLLMGGFKAPVQGMGERICHEAIEAAFPDGVFPQGAIHEFLTGVQEGAAATAGFIAALAGALMKKGAVCIWVGRACDLFPPALLYYGVTPDKVIFIDVASDKDALLVAEDALRCPGLAVVVAEVRDMTFTQSRRLQLAVESSRVTGFVLRSNVQRITETACIARWRIGSAKSHMPDDMPGVGFPNWKVELMKVRNGVPGMWQVGWYRGRFLLTADNELTIKAPVQEGVKKAV